MFQPQYAPELFADSDRLIHTPRDSRLSTTSCATALLTWRNRGLKAAEIVKSNYNARFAYVS